MKVLIVDDHERTIGSLRDWFQIAYPDFSILTALNGRIALDLYTKNEHEIDLVITDNDMPVMSGVDFVKEVRALKPDQKVIMSSAGEKTDEIRQLRIIFRSKLAKGTFVAFLKDVLDRFNDPVVWN